jgi:hypothetical protein
MTEVQQPVILSTVEENQNSSHIHIFKYPYEYSAKEKGFH